MPPKSARPNEGPTNRTPRAPKKRTTRALTDSTDVDDKVVECIGRQSGGRTITPRAQLGSLGVSGLTLAGCLNSKFGDKFKGGDFPGTMEVAACIRFVRGKVAGN